jgi:hypothetical protein
MAIFGLCCFCGRDIKEIDTDPCRLSVASAKAPDKWQVWFCHAACFKERLAEVPGAPGFFDPAHV